jgi:hypothetical protein
MLEPSGPSQGRGNPPPEELGVVGPVQDVGHPRGRQRRGVAEDPALVGIALGAQHRAARHPGGHELNAFAHGAAILGFLPHQSSGAHHQGDLAVDENTAGRFRDEARLVVPVGQQEEGEPPLVLDVQGLVDDGVDRLQATALQTRVAQGHVGQAQDQKSPAHKVPLLAGGAHPADLGAAAVRVGPECQVVSGEAAGAQGWRLRSAELPGRRAVEKVQTAQPDGRGDGERGGRRQHAAGTRSVTPAESGIQSLAECVHWILPAGPEG